MKKENTFTYSLMTEYEYIIENGTLEQLVSEILLIPLNYFFRNQEMFIKISEHKNGDTYPVAKITTDEFISFVDKHGRMPDIREYQPIYDF